MMKSDMQGAISAKVKDTESIYNQWHTEKPFLGTG